MKYPFLPLGSLRAVRLRSPIILFLEGSLQHKGRPYNNGKKKVWSFLLLLGFFVFVGFLGFFLFVLLVLFCVFFPQSRYLSLEKQKQNKT